MTLEEAQKLITFVSTMYQNFKVETVGNENKTAMAWQWVFKNENYTHVTKALKYFIQTATHNFPPTPQEIWACLRIVKNKNDLVTADEAFHNALKICRKACAGRVIFYKDLPARLAKSIKLCGGASAFKNLSTDQLPFFRKTFKEIWKDLAEKELTLSLLRTEPNLKLGFENEEIYAVPAAQHIISANTNNKKIKFLEEKK